MPAPLPSIALLLPSTTYDAGLFSYNQAGWPVTTATQLRAHRRLSCAVGSFALNGQDATLTKGTLTTDYPAPLPALTFFSFLSAGTYRLVAETGTFAISSNTATNLRYKRTLTAEVGTFTWSGAPAERDMELNADVRLFQVIGQAATLRRSYTLVAAVGSYAINGQSAGYVLTASGNKRMTAETGYFAINRPGSLPIGVDLETATLRYSRVLECDYGAFVLNGQRATLDGPRWQPVPDSSGSWVYVTPSGGVWTDVDPDA